MEIIKTERLKNNLNISLIKFDDLGDSPFEVQVSNDEKIIETDGHYSKLKEGLEVYCIMKEEFNIKNDY